MCGDGRVVLIRVVVRIVVSGGEGCESEDIGSE